MKFRILVAMLAFAVALSTHTAFAQELLTNPGFEDTNADTNYGDNWGSFGAAGFHAFFGPNGHASLFPDNVNNSGGVYQLGISGTPGLEYHFDLLDTRIEANFDANLEFGLEFYLGDDATQISAVLQNIPDPGVEVNGGVYGMMAVAPAGTVFVRPIIKYDSVGSNGGQHNVFVFDASLTAVPEPGTFLLAGCAGLWCVTSRRRP